MRRAHPFRPPRRAAAPAAKRIAARGAAPGPAPTPLFGPGLADKVPLILFSYDLRTQRLLHCNRHCHTVLGYGSEELLGWGSQLVARLLHIESRAQLAAPTLQRQLANDQPVSWDCRVRHRNGSWRWLRIRVRAGSYDSDGQARELIGSAEDVTSHRAAVEELRQNRHLLRQVLDLVPGLVYIYDLREEGIVYANRRTEAVLGYTGDELAALPRGQLLAHLLPADAQGPVRAQLAELAEAPDERVLTLEFAMLHRDGSRRWLHSTHTPFSRDAAGRVARTIGVADDVTQRRLAEARGQADTLRLGEQHRLFQQVINALPHPIYLKDAHGGYLLANEALATLFDLSPDELMRDGVPPRPAATTDLARFQSQDQQVLATGQELTIEESFICPDGTVAWFSSVKRRFERADGTSLVLGIDSNITELKRTQQALETAIATARVDAQAKQDFLANMSHEIRTPLHGILGLTGVLAKTTLSRSQHDYLRLLGESADHLLAVLNDVLTTARLGAGKLRPETTAFRPEELLAGCAALLRPRAREKGLRMRVEKPPALPALLGDPHRLRQILLNLLSNAIKFTPTGQVLLRCRLVAGPPRHAEPAGTVWLQFLVSDTGVGMSAETLEQVFEPFAQAAASTDREYGGSGLGLGISEGLVALLGGVLRVSSAVGQGSTFAFVLAFQAVPMAAAPLPEAPPARPPTAPALGRVLLVEDNLVNSLLAETVLRNWGWQVTTAASGPAAIQLFEHRPFDLVLMDIQMPGMDGETAAGALRQHPDPARAATPVIALTARAQAGEAERLRAAGFAGYLAKPYREEQLLHAIQTVLEHHNHAAEPTSPYRTVPMSTANPLYDLSNVRQLVRHDETIVRRLAWAFIETTPAILTALDEALTRADWEAVGDAAHHLKSSLDGLGVESLRAVIREVEAYGDTLPAPAHAARQVAQVRATTELVMAGLRREFPEQQQ